MDWNLLIIRALLICTSCSHSHSLTQLYPLLLSLFPLLITTVSSFCKSSPSPIITTLFIPHSIIIFSFWKHLPNHRTFPLHIDTCRFTIHHTHTHTRRKKTDTSQANNVPTPCTRVRSSSSYIRVIRISNLTVLIKRQLGWAWPTYNNTTHPQLQPIYKGRITDFPFVFLGVNITNLSYSVISVCLSGYHNVTYQREYVERARIKQEVGLAPW